MERGGQKCDAPRITHQTNPHHPNKTPHQNPSKPGTRQLCHNCWWAEGFHAVLGAHPKQLLYPDALKPPPAALRAWEAHHGLTRVQTAPPLRRLATDETWVDVDAGGTEVAGTVRLRGKILQV